MTIPLPSPPRLESFNTAARRRARMDQTRILATKGIFDPSTPATSVPSSICTLLQTRAIRSSVAHQRCRHFYWPTFCLEADPPLD